MNNDFLTYNRKLLQTVYPYFPGYRVESTWHRSGKSYPLRYVYKGFSGIKAV